MRYNLALLPEHAADQFIDLAAPFTKGADYLLSRQHSYPHITLTQFYASEDYNLDQLWSQANEAQHALYSAALELHFIRTNYSLGSFGYAAAAEYVWLALLPEYHPQVFALHKKLVALLKQQGIACLNAALEKYFPHLTLARSTDLSHIENLKTINIDLKDTFCLALGRSDNIGQFVEILKISEA